MSRVDGGSDRGTELGRRALLSGGALLAASLVWPRRAPSPRDGDEPEALDEALRLAHRFGPEYGGGLSHHGPMAAEALAYLGHAAETPGWVASYARRRRLEEAPATRPSFEPADWRAHLGRIEDYARWRSLFEHALAEAPWKDVLAVWLPRLVPGLAAAAAHGPIRVAHAVRSLEARESEPRLRELAIGLAYWAARHQTLPGTPRRAGELAPSEALARVEVLPARRHEGLIFEELRALDELESFTGAIDLVDSSRADFLSELAATFARQYVVGPRRYAFSFVHAVTGPATLRQLLPHVEESGREIALRHAWQLAAGIHAVYWMEPDGDGPPPEALDPEHVAVRAIENGSAHALKLAAACLQEWRVVPEPIFLSAARLGAETLTG